MAWWLPHNFEQKREFLNKRNQILRAIRSFFDDNGFAEVETPILQICPTFDMHIHGFKTAYYGHDLAHKRDYYLQTSPELDMKKLLVAGMSRIYQICHVFRNAEGGRLHSPEFTMIEWYRANADYRQIMEDCIKLLRHVAEGAGIKAFTYRDKESDPFEKWQILSVVEAFEIYAGMDLSLYLDSTEKFSNAVSVSGIRVAEDDRWDDLFFRVMAERIEPNLGFGVPTILYDYPVSMAALSRKKTSDARFAERFELYVCGIELANAFSELTDSQVQRERFSQDMQAKQDLYGYQYPPDNDFFRALEYGMPESGGIALGIDRLVMLACGAEHIGDVLWTEPPGGA